MNRWANGDSLVIILTLVGTSQEAPTSLGGGSTSLGNYFIAALQAIVVIVALFDAYLYRKPYLGLSEGKLIINNGLAKKVILLKDVTSLEQTEKQLKLTYNEGPSAKQQKIQLPMLKDIDKEEFLQDIKPSLTL